VSDSSFFQAALLKLLKPLARILLRNGIPYKLFAEVTKRAYVQVATEEFGIKGKRQTDSRISTITGLTRKDVLRIRLETDAGESLTEQYNRAARVISAWIREPLYQGEHGEPALLPVRGAKKSFHALVKQASGDITAATILDELLRVKAVRYTDDGHVALISRAYIPHQDSGEKIKILGTDVADLINTIDHNIATETRQPRFQRKVCYDNLPQEQVAQIRNKIEKTAQAALESMDREISAYDRDHNLQLKGTGRKRAGIGIYYFEEDASDDN